MPHSGAGRTRSWELDVSMGLCPGFKAVDKFGEADDADSGVATDVWDGADAAGTSTKVHVLPTVARVHNLVSTDAADDTDSGTGMRNVLVEGLKTWADKESSEVVELEGATPVATANSYVIIHRMKGVAFGSGKTNAGIIKATAVTDATITAMISIGEGQTKMAIYGVPSTQNIYIRHLYGTVLRSSGAATKVDGKILVMENADLATAAFITKEVFQYADDHGLDREYALPKKFTGPCVIKLRAVSNAANSSVTSAFDAFLVDN